MSQQSSWGAVVGTAVALQWLLILVLSAAAGLLSGTAAAMSLLAGGAAVALPNSVLALWLTLRVRRSGTAGASAMLMGEILKLGLTIAVLVVLIARFKPELSWLALMLGVLVALKAQWLALWVTRRY